MKTIFIQVASYSTEFNNDENNTSIFAVLENEKFRVCILYMLMWMIMA